MKRILIFLPALEIAMIVCAGRSNFRVIGLDANSEQVVESDCDKTEPNANKNGLLVYLDGLYLL
jgi:hypothetical protein